MDKMEVKRLWRGFWQVADPRSWIASTIPMFVGAALAYGTRGRFSLPWFLLSLVGIYLIETGKNASNEYVDYKTGVPKPKDIEHIESYAKALEEMGMKIKEKLLVYIDNTTVIVNKV